MKIAYCDDMKKDRDKIMASLSNIEEKWGKKFEIISFSSGEKLCESLKYNTYHVILLDIIMDGMDGIETAKKIRFMGEDSLIIFVLSYNDRWRELFDIGTIAFLDKPLKIKKLETALKRAYNYILDQKSRIFTFNSNRVQKFVYLQEIVYLESRDYKVEMLTTKERVTFNDSLKNVWNKLKKNEEFIMPNRSYIVNLKYARIVNANKIRISTNQLEITIGRTLKETTIQRYMRFIRRRSA